MSNWITDRATEIRRAEKEKTAERDRQVTASNELKAKTRPFWNELIRALEQAVKEFNAEFPEAERRIDQWEKPHSGLLMRRNAYPSVTVKANLSSAETTVQYTISRTQRKGTDPVEKQSSFAFKIVDQHVEYVGDALSTHDDVARLFLEPFFEF